MTDLRTARGILVSLLSILLTQVPAPAGATLTDPVLAVTRAKRVDGASFSLIEIEGSFPFDDLVQLPVALQVLVYDPGTGAYLRFDLVAGGFGGIEPGLADGLDVQEAQALLAAGSGQGGVQLVALEPGRLALQAPPGLLPDSSRVQIFLENEGQIALSNGVAVENLQ